MKADQLIKIRDEISALLMAKLKDNVEAEHAAVTQAAAQLEYFGGMGGSTRAKAEAEIVRLMQRFDNTPNQSDEQLPVSEFMSNRAKRTENLRAALVACIAAHRTGRFEPMVAAIEAARKVIAKQSN